MFSFGSSRSRSSSQATASSTSSSFSRTDQDVFLADLFQQLMGGATSAAAGINTDPLTETSNRLFSAGEGVIERLTGGGSVVEGAGVNRVGDISLPGSTADAEIEQLQADLGRLFSEEINPEITSRGVATGTLGGGRQGVAQGRAAEGIAREFTRGATDIRSRDIARQLEVQRLNQEAGFRNEALAAAERERVQRGRLAEGDQQLAALSALPSLFDLSQGGTMASLSPFLALSQILGGPTVLTTQRGESESQSESQQTSTSKSGGFSFGFAGRS